MQALKNELKSLKEEVKDMNLRNTMRGSVPNSEKNSAPEDFNIGQRNKN